MQVFEVTRIDSPSDETEAHYVVRANDGDTFDLSFQADLLDTWREQLARSSTPFDLNHVATKLAEEIAVLSPSKESLHDGLVVTMDNGASTPMAAEYNLRISGIGPFSKHEVPVSDTSHAAESRKALRVLVRRVTRRGID